MEGDIWGGGNDRPSSLNDITGLLAGRLNEPSLPCDVETSGLAKDGGSGPGTLGSLCIVCWASEGGVLTVDDF